MKLHCIYSPGITYSLISYTSIAFNSLKNFDIAMEWTKRCYRTASCDVLWLLKIGTYQISTLLFFIHVLRSWAWAMHPNESFYRDSNSFSDFNVVFQWNAMSPTRIWPGYFTSSIMRSRTVSDMSAALRVLRIEVYPLWSFCFFFVLIEPKPCLIHHVHSC